MRIGGSSACLPFVCWTPSGVRFIHAAAFGAASPGKALLSRRVLRARAVVDVVPGVTARCTPAPLSAGGGAAHAAHAAHHMKFDTKQISVKLYSKENWNPRKWS